MVGHVAVHNRHWVADFTHVKSWSATVYVALVVDTFSQRFAGWPAATVKESVFVLDAPEMVICQHDLDHPPLQPSELIHHSDAGPQDTSRDRACSTGSCLPLPPPG
ncbi:DDE-type integrase/transposase/recombinase [Streptomyces sp. NPDC052052]|uniref:DDE-type integrase/transposase/recombinase n=1 Tax=Streptomyces sp. NPDC052052 TaxID=3154756 RepID=UPI00343F6C91